MKNFSKITILLAFTLISTSTLFAQKELPDTEVTTLQGERISISEHAKNGKITVLSFWATWCSPCKKELDAISEVYEDWQELYDMELVAISVDNTRSMAKVGPMVAQKAWDYQIYLDPNQQLQNSLNFRVVPQTYVLDKQGNIVYEHTGYVPGDEYELEDKLAELSKL